MTRRVSSVRLDLGAACAVSVARGETMEPGGYVLFARRRTAARLRQREARRLRGCGVIQDAADTLKAGPAPNPARYAGRAGPGEGGGCEGEGPAALRCAQPASMVRAAHSLGMPWFSRLSFLRFCGVFWFRKKLLKAKSER